MSLDSIIKAATPGPWVASSPSCASGASWALRSLPEAECATGCDCGFSRGICEGLGDDNNAAYIATFDPTMTAAMLAACLEARHTCGFDRNGSHSADAYVEYDCALCDLEALLAERGLTLVGE